MAEPTSTPIGIAILDEMIARAETACDRGRAELAARRKPYLRVRPNRFGGQQAMEDTLARLRAQRAAIENTRQIDKKRACDERGSVVVAQPTAPMAIAEPKR